MHNTYTLEHVCGCCCWEEPGSKSHIWGDGRDRIDWLYREKRFNVGWSETDSSIRPAICNDFYFYNTTGSLLQFQHLFKSNCTCAEPKHILLIWAIFIVIQLVHIVLIINKLRKTYYFHFLKDNSLIINKKLLSINEKYESYSLNN